MLNESPAPSREITAHDHWGTRAPSQTTERPEASAAGEFCIAGRGFSQLQPTLSLPSHTPGSPPATASVSPQPCLSVVSAG